MSIQTNNRGMILVTVLVLTGLISVFAAVAAISVRAGADASRGFAETMQAEDAMRGAIERLVGSAGASGLPPSGSTVVTLGPTRVDVAFHDEIGRIDLNAAPIEMLAGIFRVTGSDGAAAKIYAARIVDWRDADDKVTQGGAEKAAYRAAGRIDGPRNGPFQHIAELALVLGIPARAAAAVAPYVTVASGSEQINPILADPPTLLALPGVSEDRVRHFLDARKGTNVSPDALIGELGDVSDYVTTDTSKAVRVEARVHLGGNDNRYFEAVVTIIPGDSEPYRILAWNANPPGRVRAP